MRIYFVRHGESEANKNRIEQWADGPLSDYGKLQAAYVGRRFSGMPVEAIISSTFERARQTAEIINKNLNKEIIFSDLFVERRPPSKVLGKKINDPKVLAIHEKIRQLRQKPESDNARLLDEENFEDFKERAVKALKYLEKQEKRYDKILVVTHGGFLRMLMAVMIFGRTLTYQEYINILFAFKTSNTGVTLCEYNSHNNPNRPEWRIIAWNDHAHLGNRAKSLKFRSHHVPSILSADVTITLRIFDEKNIQKDDELILINSDTDREFGKGIVLSVKERRLKNLQKHDFPTHDNHKDIDSIFDTYKGYYGSEVTPNTPVKVIEFELVR